MNPENTPLLPTRILRLKEVWKRLGISRSKGYLLMRRDITFPKRLSLGGRTVGILEGHLTLWITQQLAAK